MDATHPPLEGGWATSLEEGGWFRVDPLCSWKRGRAGVLGGSGGGYPDNAIYMAAYPISIDPQPHPIRKGAEGFN